jgi:hypothetical protein
MLFGWRKKQDSEEKRRLRFQIAVALEEFQKAKHELYIAENHVQNCDVEFFDIANKQLTIAYDKVDVALQKQRKLRKDLDDLENIENAQKQAV